ncbi:8-amino-7-oxononanoate synthase [Halomonas cupida]|uniref:8-amino-7-oxononanoate synthase n=1 Tax=Halomonas cupida TaxID=44933 RepID=A0A1M7HVD5_9GAMM|nr:8-amino-7-oxononanoate synthase [Halomonas cupida]GEN23909.1 8-amino-7-oxononanoate synthase [Halomonas cupida]SHM32378.1 8-amino-7-oxononanoate synthase [Halomonas cupida]
MSSTGNDWQRFLAHKAAEQRQAGRWRCRLVRGTNDALIDFASNDYLGLANDPRVIAAQHQGARLHGAGSGASHLVTGHSQAHHELEEALAQHTGRQRALLFSTGYMANLGVLQALCDTDTQLFQDRLNHASLLDGAKLAGARSRRYHHADGEDLRRLLARADASQRRLIVSDGVFSMDGDVAPLDDLTSIAAQHQAWLMIDDAHGLGVLGNDGDGCVGRHYASDQVQVLVGTLGKALGTAGAFVAGDTALIEHLIQFARPYIYTTALPPGVASASLASLHICVSEPERRHHLQALIARFRHEAASIGLPLMGSSSPIQPLLLGEESRVMHWSRQLGELGFRVGAIRPPTVARGQARLRITLSARHDFNDVHRLLEALQRCQQEEQGQQQGQGQQEDHT